MSASAQANFAARLLERMGRSRLIDAVTGEVIEGAQARDGVVRFAAQLRSSGLQPGDRVLIGCNLRPLCSLAYLGAMYGGFIAVPVNESALESSGPNLASKTGARVVWTERRIPGAWPGHEGLRQLDGWPAAAACRDEPAEPCHEDAVAALMATSGSTGTPRLVRVTHGNLTANTEAIVRSQRLGADERAMLILPVNYCFGASVLQTHLYQGGSVVFDSRFMFPDKVLRAIAQFECTTFAGVPTAYHILVRRSNLRNIALPSLRRFLQAGGPLSDERVREMRTIVPHADFFVMYGQTEATARISCLPPERLDDKLGSVGVPLDNLSVRIVDDEGNELPAGRSGELWVRGRSVCTSYVDEPEETAQKFRGGWLATGDLARRDEDGYLWITGRKSEFIKMRGVRLSFAEIEQRVAAVTGVCECAALAVPHVEAGEALALYVVAGGTPADVVAAVRRSLPREWICDSVNLLAELPRNSHGKLVRARLVEMARSSASGSAREAGGGKR